MTGAGLVNAHTHLYSGLAPFGMPAPAEAPQNFVQILERVWWKLDRALGALPPGSILSHGVHLGEAQVRPAKTHINLDAIRAEATSEAPRLWSRMAEI